MAKKKIIISVGTRPNFIKITQFDKEFKKYGDYFDYKLVHTGQHYDKNMSKIFFDQFKLKQPDLYLDVKGMQPCEQIGEIIIKLGAYIENWKPDLVMVVGDVNATLAGAIAANKNGARIAHLESGLRSNDRIMPEEINRILADTITDDFFVTEQSGIENLENEINRKANIHFVGNTMIDTLVAFDEHIQRSKILQKLNVNNKKFVLMTMHRPRNVDNLKNLEKILDTIDQVTSFFYLIFPMHPRTYKNFERFNLLTRLNKNNKLIVTPPMDYLAFQKLISLCELVITDSGGIQEETTFRQVPCLTLRKNTERPVTIQMGTNELMEFDLNMIENRIKKIKMGEFKKGVIPPLWDGKATERIVKILAESL